MDRSAAGLRTDLCKERDSLHASATPLRTSPPRCIPARPSEHIAAGPGLDARAEHLLAARAGAVHPRCGSDHGRPRQRSQPGLSHVRLPRAGWRKPGARQMGARQLQCGIQQLRGRPANLRGGLRNGALGSVPRRHPRLDPDRPRAGRHPAVLLPGALHHKLPAGRLRLPTGQAGCGWNLPHPCGRPGARAEPALRRALRSRRRIPAQSLSALPLSLPAAARAAAARLPANRSGRHPDAERPLGRPQLHPQ